MALPHAPQLLTVSDLEALGTDDLTRLELRDGALIETEPMGQRHGEYQLQISSVLHLHVWRNRLGRVYPSDTHFILFRDPDTVVIPDVSFVRADRLAPDDARDGFAPYPPDFAVEVRSPTDRPGEVAEKVALYLRAGVRLIWVVAPRSRTVTVYTPDAEPRTVGRGEALDGGEVIPGFLLPVADIFA